MLTFAITYMGGALLTAALIALTQPFVEWKPFGVAIVLWPVALVAMSIALCNDLRRYRKQNR